MKENNPNLKIAYFGGEPLSVPVLEELKTAGIIPNLIVCNPDRPSGRKMIPTSPPTKVWAKENNIEVFQPEDYKVDTVRGKFEEEDFDLFIVVAYNKILPQWLIDLPRHKTINLHPSLLPKLRGPSPIRSAILNNIRETGVTIMQMDEQMDHGPIIAQRPLVVSEENWPIDGTELDLAMSHLGGTLLASVIPDWTEGKIIPTPQNHDQATFCHKITKAMAELEIDPYNLPKGKEAYDLLLKIRAFSGWPETFFIYKDKRIKIKQAEIDKDGQLKIIKITPEGKVETNFESYFK